MSAEETEQKVDEQTKNIEPEPEKKEEQRAAEPPRITNDTVETDPVRKVVNKKLSTMSKESKEGKKHRKRVLKPPKDEFRLPEREARESVEEAPQSEKPKESESKKHGIKGPDHSEASRAAHAMDPFYAQRHKNAGIFTFDD